jgi:hypothetical protein
MPIELMIPPWARVSSGRFDFLSNTVAFPSTFTGAIRSTDRLGDRVGVNFSTQNASHRETAPTRALLSAIRASMRGQSARIWFTDPGYQRRGSFPATELLSNNTFANGTTGFNVGGSPVASLSVADRVLRVNRTGGGGNNPQVDPASLPTTVQYAPYALRGFFSGLRGNPTLAAYHHDGTIEVENILPAGTGGYVCAAQVVRATAPAQLALYDRATSGGIAGDYFDVSWMSYARCTLVDNGQNLLLRSDEFDNAAWTKINCTITTGDTAPDGSTAGDSLVENGAAGQHFVIQTPAAAVSSSALDYCICVALRANGRSWAVIGLSEATGGTSVFDYFNLSNGAIGAFGATGANWSNRRSFTVFLGNGWYLCCVVARKTNAATSLSAFVNAATADGTSNYTGTNGLSAIRMWRATQAQSSVPTRLVLTTSAASTGTSQTGPGYYTKGWPASTNGLLLTDDWVQIGRQPNKVVAPVNSDAAGLAYLQLAYPLRTAPSDNAPVIIHEPFGRFVSADNQGGYDFRPGVFTDHEFQLIEDLAT